MTKRKVDPELLLTGSCAAWARHVLLTVGFDATVEDANAFVEMEPRIPYVENKITDEDLQRAREALWKEDPGKAYESKTEMDAKGVLRLAQTSMGRRALRKTLRSLPHKYLLEVLGLDQ